MRDQEDVVDGPALPGHHLAGFVLPLLAPLGQGPQHRLVVEAAQQRQFAQFGGDDLDRGPLWTNVIRPSPTSYTSRRLTRYVPPFASTQGSIRTSHRELMPCICGTVFVVVARFRAAAIPRLSCARAAEWSGCSGCDILVPSLGVPASRRSP
ncbi:hypothetical protein J2Z21_000693 [Streptomyces griseochromogenes]|uniref:Uncharacterized protein n=1 Tax=Streptomyces griseochromogenes TaxID=68214 RepID=A0ABS4LK67_9ACTN|nr:hypothetical protein [Streptomyces griseochromogenes]